MRIEATASSAEGPACAVSPGGGAHLGRCARAVLAATVSLACIPGLTGCGALAGNGLGTAQLRIIDAAPNAGSLDIFSGEAALAYNLRFGTVTSYMAVVPAVHSLSAKSTADHNINSGVHAALNGSQQYTLLLGESDGSLQSVLLEDQRQPAPAGQSSVRVLNMARRSGPVDLYVIAQGAPVRSATLLTPSLTFGTNAGYRNVPAGQYRLLLVPSGTAPVSSGNAVSAGIAEMLPAAGARTLVLLDQPRSPAGGAGVQLVTAIDYDPAAEGQ